MVFFLFHLPTISTLIFILALDFLHRKGHVLHGDLSMYNIMIGRVWPEESDLTPSELRAIACALNAIGANADGGDSPKSQPDLATDGALADHRATVLNNSTSSDNTPVDYLGTHEPIESCGMLIDSIS